MQVHKKTQVGLNEPIQKIDISFRSISKGPNRFDRIIVLVH
jgi:hypothetical protein